jgi:hypothetical protein
MATREQLKAAILKADAAGDTESAARFAEMYKTAAPETPPAAPKPATLVSTVKRAAWNLPMDTAETLKGVMTQFGPEGLPVQAVMHPVKTFDAARDAAGKAADVLTGGLQRVREMSPEASQGSAPAMDTATYDATAKNLHDNWGTKQGIYKNVGDHPASTALAAASVLNPALKAAGALDYGAAADVLATGANAGIKAKTGLDFGAAADVLRDGMKPRPKPVPPPGVEALQKSSSALYKEAKQAGVVIKDPAYKTFAASAKDIADEFGIDPDLHPRSSAALKRIQNENGGDVSLNKLQILRKIAGDATEATDKPDRTIARRLLDHVDDFAEKLDASQIAAGDAPKAMALLNKARTTWQQAARGDTIEKLIAKARQNAGPLKTNLDDAYRTQFRKLANNERGIARFTEEQQQAIKHVAFGDGPVQSVLHGFGRIIPHNPAGALTTSGVGAAAHIVGLPVTAPVAATVGSAGLTGKIASTMITSKNAKLASELARGGTAPRTGAYRRIAERRAARETAEKGN